MSDVERDDYPEEVEELKAQVRELTITLRTIAEFPITDPANQDAKAMAALAASALPSDS